MSSAGPGGAASSADHQAPRTPQSHSDPCTVHEFLTRVVTDPHTRAAFQADPAATPAEIEDALKSSAHKFSFGAPYEQAGSYTSSYDKGTGLVDVVAAVQALVG